MDEPDAEPVALRKSLRFIRVVNKLLGYSWATIYHLDQLCRDWKPGRPITILDVATGSGDIPQAILRRAGRKKLDVAIVAVDLHEQTLLTAARINTDRRIRFIRADATRLPFDDSTFDFVLTGMFLHHLDPTTAGAALSEMDRVATRGMVVADLLRSRRAYGWIVLFTLFANPMVRHDARVSVSGAFTAAELIALCTDAGVKYLKPHRHFGHRLVLAGSK